MTRAVYRLIHPFLLVVLTQAMLGCAGGRQFTPPAPLPDDRTHVPAIPVEKKTNIMWDGFKRQMVQPGGDVLDFSRWLRKLAGCPKEAFNVDAFGEVPNSSWFTNRNALHALTPAEVFRGPDRVDGPDTEHPLTVVKAKTIGVTPGFVMRDSRGDTYVVKLDPPGFNELNSGAEVVTTKLLYAAGYNVPENFAVELDPALLTVGDKVKFTGRDGTKRFMTDEDLREIINSRVELTADGKIRAMASRYIDGKPIGPFLFKSTRDDDPNDFIPHEHRRELRGARVVFAWLAHYDTNVSNFLDSYVTEDSTSYVKHYLIDFGAALGSHPSGAKPADRGTEPYMDPVFLLNKTAELGLIVRPRDRQVSVQIPAVGRFSSADFHPKSFKFIFPTRAFEYYTPLDAYWGAKIVASFSEEQIRAAVEAGRYSDPAARDLIVNTLMERRDIVCRYWFGRIAPLDNFVVNGENVEFDDLAVKSGLEKDGASFYRLRVYRDGRRESDWTEIGSTTHVSDSLLASHLPATASGPDASGQIAVELQVKRPGRSWSHSVTVYLRQTGEGRELFGVERDA